MSNPDLVDHVNKMLGPDLDDVQTLCGHLRYIIGSAKHGMKHQSLTCNADIAGYLLRLVLDDAQMWACPKCDHLNPDGNYACSECHYHKGDGLNG